MKKFLFLFLFPLMAVAQTQPTGIYNGNVGITLESDLWIQDGLKWSPIGNAYLLNRPMATVSNVTTLINAPCWSNTLAKVIQTLGYYTPGDGGGGAYQMVPKTTTNMGQFASTNSAYMWQLMPDLGGTRLRQYGAKGDGTTDDTLSVIDWLHDIDRKVGVATPGRYLISPIFTEANAILTIQGLSKFGMAGPNMSGQLFSGNSAMFKRKDNSGTTNALINVVSNATCNIYNLVLDGNKTGDPTQTSAYLYLINGGKSSEIESCYFANSAGHGIGVVGPGGDWTVIRNCRIYNVNRGIRLNQTSGVILNNIHIQYVRENGLWLTGFANLTRANQLFIADCAENGIIIEAAQNNRFNDVIIQTTFKSSVMFATTNVNNSTDNHFFQGIFRGANAASSALLGASPYAANLYAAVSVTGNSGADYSIRNRFDGCVFGDINGTLPSRGKYNFEWLAPVSGSHYPWELWILSNNQHVWNAGWTGDFSPAITNSVGEVNNIRANNEFASQFGKSGVINSAGWRFDIVEAGTASSTNKALYANDGHKLMRDTTGFGTVIPPTGLLKEILQPIIRPTPLSDP